MRSRILQSLEKTQCLKPDATGRIGCTHTPCENGYRPPNMADKTHTLQEWSNSLQKNFDELRISSEVVLSADQST